MQNVLNPTAPQGLSGGKRKSKGKVPSINVKERSARSEQSSAVIKPQTAKIPPFNQFPILTTKRGLVKGSLFQSTLTIRACVYVCTKVTKAAWHYHKLQTQGFDAPKRQLNKIIIHDRSGCCLFWKSRSWANFFVHPLTLHV